MYAEILSDIEGVFAETAWTDNAILTLPENFQGVIGNTTEYVRLKVMPSTSSHYDYSRNKLITGLLAVKIFVKAGEGQKRTMAIAELLDNVLENRLLPSGTRLGVSYLQTEGLDQANKSLYSASYFINFTRHGE